MTASTLDTSPSPADQLVLGGESRGSEILVLKLCALSGVATVVVFTIGFWGIAGFVPPPSPGWEAHRVAEFYRDNSLQIRVGIIVAMFGATLCAPWVYATTYHLWRVGRHRILVLTQLGLGTLLILEFIITMVPWQIAAYRTELPDDSVRLMSDLAWVPFMGLGNTAILQCVITAVIILSDERAEPIFPRWVGYLNLWIALCFMPGPFLILFKDGPIAWNGLITFWLAFVAFFTWFVVNGWACYRAAAMMRASQSAEPGPAVLAN